MTRALKVGQRKKMNKSEAVKFAEQFLGQSSLYRDNFSSSSFVRIGPNNLRLFVDENLKVGELVKHAFLPSDESDCLADLEVWNSSTGLRLPDLFWIRENKNLVFEVRGLEDTKYRIAFDRGQGFIYVFDREARRGAIWTRDVHELHMGSFITPFRLMISWMANTFGGEIVHASAIELGGKGLLINGPSGSGKSTLAIAAALNGAKILGDDVILNYGNRLYAVYSRCKLIKNEISPDVSRLESLYLKDFDSEKEIISLQSFKDNFTLSTEFHAMIFPLIAQMSVHQKIKSAVALKIFLPNSLTELFGGTPENFFRHANLVKQHPCFRLGLSGDLSRDLAELLKILDEI